jgi:hypothetical protein
MRKIISLIILTVATHICFAQFGTVQFSPATFTGDDDVTMTIDLTGTPLEGESEVYIWSFTNSGSLDPQYPSKDGITNTAWGNSPDVAKFTNTGGNTWSYTFKGADLFLLTPGQLKYFQFLVKTKTGNKQTGDSPQFPFAPVAYVPAVYRLFPGYSTQEDAITIYFYQNLSTELVESRMTPVSATVTFYNGATVVGSPVTLPMSGLGDKLFSSATFIPSQAIPIPAGTTLTKFTYSVNGAYYDTGGNPVTVSGATNTKTFDILH